LLIVILQLVVLVGFIFIIELVVTALVNFGHSVDADGFLRAASGDAWHSDWSLLFDFFFRRFFKTFFVT
jgi:hypothetical protein